MTDPGLDATRRVAERMPRAAAAATTGAAFYCLALGACVWSHYDFDPGDAGGVVSWVTRHRYPIHQESVAWFGSLASVIGGVLLGRPLWIELARRLPKRWASEPSGALAVSAGVFASLGTAAVGLLSGQFGNPIHLVWPLALAAAVGLGLALAPASPIVRFLAANPHPEPASPHPGHRTRNWIWRILVPLLLYGALYDASQIFMAPIDALHEGERLAHIVHLRAGDLPYRDFYIQHGLGQDVLKPWLADQLLDGTVAAQRLVERALRPLGAIAVYLLGLAYFRSGWTALALALALTAGRLDVHDRMVLGLLSVAALLKAHRSADSATAVPPDRTWLVAAGSLAGLAFWYSTEVGLYAGATAAVVLTLAALPARTALADRARPLIWFAAGGAIGVLPVAVWLLAAGAGTDLVHNTWLQLTLQRDVWGLAYPPIETALQAARSGRALLRLLDSRVFEFYLPMGVVLVSAGSLAHRVGGGGRVTDREALPRLAVTTFAVFAVMSALGRSDYRHLMFAAAPAYTVLFGALESGVIRAVDRGRAADRGTLDVARAAAVAAAVACVLTFFVVRHDIVSTHTLGVWRAVSGSAWPAANRPLVWEPLGRMAGDPGQIPYLRAVSDYISETTAPGEAFYDFTHQAIFFHLAGRPSASRYLYAAYAATPALEEEVIAELEADRTRLVLFRSGHASDTLDGIPIAERQPAIDRYLRSHYAPAHRIGGTVFLLRK